MVDLECCRESLALEAADCYHSSQQHERCTVATLVLDFDSTVVSCETLEEILRPKLSAQPDLMVEIERLTREAMAGRMAFGEALEARLKIAAPSRQEVESFGQQLSDKLSRGMAQLIENLQASGTEVWIVSGGLKEALLPVARQLGITEERVCAVTLRWSDTGTLLGLNPDDPFAQSKYAGAKTVAEQWIQPAIGVGDGMTDYELYEKGLVQDFVIYAEHVQRQSVLSTGMPVAKNCEELWKLLHKRLSDDAVLS